MATSLWKIWAIEKYDEFSVWSANEIKNNSINKNSPWEKWIKVLKASNRLSKIIIIALE